MIDDRDVWQAAVLLVRRYGDDAMLVAAVRADQLLGRRRDHRRITAADAAVSAQWIGTVNPNENDGP